MCDTTYMVPMTTRDKHSANTNYIHTVMAMAPLPQPLLAINYSDLLFKDKAGHQRHTLLNREVIEGSIKNHLRQEQLIPTEMEIVKNMCVCVCVCVTVKY